MGYARYARSVKSPFRTSAEGGKKRLTIDRRT